jgi:hypothetical protein
MVDDLKMTGKRFWLFVFLFNAAEKVGRIMRRIQRDLSDGEIAGSINVHKLKVPHYPGGGPVDFGVTGRSKRNRGNGSLS